MSDALTSDVPYEPDDPEIAHITRSRATARPARERAGAVAAWKQPKVHDGGTKLPPDPVFQQRLRELAAKLDAGGELTEQEAQYVERRLILRTAMSTRPSMAAKAATLLQNAQVRKLLRRSIVATIDDGESPLSLPGG